MRGERNKAVEEVRIARSEVEQVTAEVLRYKEESEMMRMENQALRASLAEARGIKNMVGF